MSLIVKIRLLHILHVSLSFSRQVGNNLIVPGGSRLIDARGKFVIPGQYILFCGKKSECFLHLHINIISFSATQEVLTPTPTSSCLLWEQLQLTTFTLVR